MSLAGAGGTLGAATAGIRRSVDGDIPGRGRTGATLRR